MGLAMAMTDDGEDISGAGTRYHDLQPFQIVAAGQELTFYAGGTDRLRALLELVNEADRSLDVCFYIFAQDDAGTQMRDALAAAAARGVAVTLIVDSFGAEADAAFFEPLTRHGGTFLCFSPKLSQRYLIRNHQKMVIADRRRAMFGGFNIEDSYFAAPGENGWNDLAIIVEGSSVAGLCDWFGRLAYWTASERGRFKDIRRAVRRWTWQDDNACWLIGGPTRGLSTWAKAVSHDLIRGTRVDILMAYFSPPKRLLKRIGHIAQTGQVRLVMAAKSDNAATIGATRSLYHYLLKKGCHVFEFTPCKLHTKLIVIDDTVYLGSANFDMRSLYLNLELMLKIEDRDLATRLRAFIDHHAAASERITPALHAERATLWNRLRWNFGWLLVSVLDYTVTRRLNLGL